MRSNYSRDFSRFRQAEKSEKHRLNREITAPEVRVIGATGEQLGILKTRDAIQTAEDAGLDLVEVAPEAKPPVCKILDYGKLKYQAQKKEAAARKKSSVQVVKELRIRYSTDSHDLETKIRNAKKFLEDGDRVRFEMRFRGREIVYKELGQEIFKQIAEKLADCAVVEEAPPMQGPKMLMVFAPPTASKPKGK